MNIPNILTTFRMVLIPVFVFAFFSGSQNSLLYSIIVFLTAGFTDILDGYIARRFNIVTPWGIVLDPLADKLMLLTVLTCLVINGYSPLWVLIIIAIKEVFMIVAGVNLFHRNVLIPASFFGKISTFLFYISVFVISINKTIGVILLYIAVLSAVIAFINYLLYYSKNKAH